MNVLPLFADEVPAGGSAGKRDTQFAISQMGLTAEHRAIARLLTLGHKVAQPIVDNDGVDLIVNYRHIVQIKATARERNGYFTWAKAEIREHVTTLMLHAFETDEWWIMDVGARAAFRGDVRLCTPRAPRYRPSKRSLVLPGDYENWAVFDCDPGSSL